jgi:hypothetical protein
MLEQGINCLTSLWWNCYNKWTVPSRYLRDKVNQVTEHTRLGMVIDIPLDPELSLHYMILFDDGTSSSVPVVSMLELIPKPIVNPTDTSHLLLPFLQIESKITLEQDGHSHEGFLTQSSDGVYCFSYKSHINKKHKDWGILLPNLTTTWHNLCIKCILLPGHSSLTFQHSPGTSSLVNHVSALNLTCNCPNSLLSALNQHIRIGTHG